MGRASFLRNQQLRAAGLKAPVDPALSKEMSRRRKLADQKRWAREFAEPIGPCVADIDLNVAAMVSGAVRRLVKRDARLARLAVLMSQADPLRTTRKELLLRAGFPLNASLPMIGWRAARDSVMQQAIAELHGPPPLVIYLGAVVAALFRIVQYAQLPRDRLNAAALIFGVADALEQEIAPAGDGESISDEERLRRVRALAAEIASGGLLWRDPADVAADRARLLAGIDLAASRC